MANEDPRGTKNGPAVGFAQAIRDIFVASINKGQFPFAIMGGALGILLFRVPEGEIVPLLKWMVETVGQGAYLGYALFLLTVFAWHAHARRMRMEFAAQVNAFKAGQKTVPKRERGTTK